jgi:hypothetical protein
LINNITRLQYSFIGIATLAVAILTVLLFRDSQVPVPIVVSPVTTPPLFSDDFSGSSLDPMKWNVTNGYETVQLTQWGQAPDLGKDADGTTYARVSLSTYNPNPEKTGKFYLGTQFHSIDRWNVKTGLEYEVRLRINKVPAGLVLGFFSYGDAGIWKDTYQKTETDFEFLTVQNSRKVWLHIWDNWNPLRQGPEAGQLYDATIDWNNGAWNVYKIRWYPDRTEWIVNDVIIRTEHEVRPGSPMGVWFNAWGPEPEWPDAYDPSLKPVSTLEENKTHSYDVDYVKVRRIPVSTSVPTGSGTGLKGAYYDSEKFSDLKFIRLDPRVDFNWASFPPDKIMQDDPFSVRWSGLLEPQYSEEYTFTANANDGIRLWVNKELVLDNWVPRRTYTRTGKINLEAGKKVPIRLDYYHQAGHSNVQLFWSSQSTPYQLVPQSQLYVEAQPAAPIFSLSSRKLSKAQDVTIKSATKGAKIRYTLDGKQPDINSPVLKSGNKLRIKYTALVRARAFLPDQVPSDTSRAAYTLEDNTAPRVALTSPLGNPVVKRMPPIQGIVSDDGSGVTRVDMVIKRLSDGLRWKQGDWVNEEWGLNATIKGSMWSVKSGLPEISDLSSGSYELKAVAYDLAGNVSGSQQTIVIDNEGPLLSIDSPLNEATVANLEGITGTAFEETNGIGRDRTVVVIRRLTDGARWNGKRWAQEWNALPTKAGQLTWKLLNPASPEMVLPEGSDLPDGRYQIIAVSYDKLGNYSEATINLNKRASAGQDKQTR